MYFTCAGNYCDASICPVLCCQCSTTTATGVYTALDDPIKSGQEYLCRSFRCTQFRINLYDVQCHTDSEWQPRKCMVSSYFSSAPGMGSAGTIKNRNH